MGLFGDGVDGLESNINDMPLGGVAHLLEEQHVIAYLLQVGFGLFLTKLIINDNGMIVLNHHTVRALHVARRRDDILFGEYAIGVGKPVVVVVTLDERLELRELLTHLIGLIICHLSLPNKA